MMMQSSKKAIELMEQRKEGQLGIFQLMEMKCLLIPVIAFRPAALHGHGGDECGGADEVCVLQENLCR